MNQQFQKENSAFAHPNTLCGAACCLFVCATIAFIAWLVISPKSASARRLWKPVVVESNGRETVLPETRQIEFWTPSVETKNYLHLDGGEVASGEKWEAIPSDDAVKQFGTLLHSNATVLGYRRVEVWGQGRSSFKPGWWWTLNVYTNSSVVDLAHIYQTYWKSPEPLFVEVIDNRGSDAQ